MAIHEVLIFPDPRLRKIAKKVDVIDDSVQKMLDDMLETMAAQHGAGLAATQINCQKRLLVIHDDAVFPDAFCLINPEILERSGEQISEEGCLSVPGFYEKVPRASWVKVRYLDREGQERIVESGNDRAASVYQHEIDHLDGKLYIDYLSRLKREYIRKKLEKFLRTKM